MKVALIYDRVNKWGGAERVLLALHDMFPDAPLYTSVYNEDTASWAKVFPKIHMSFLQDFPYAATRHELYAALMPLAFESFSFDEYEAVISVTSEAAKGIIMKPGTKHICYCLTPTRYLWSGYEEYFPNKTMRAITKPVVSYLRSWDKIAAQRPDMYVAISNEVQKRIKKYYGRDSEIIYPPVSFTAGPAARSSQGAPSSLADSNEDALPGSPPLASPAGSYFLIVSRLVPFKRIDIAVKAFNKLGSRLKIVGSGSEERKLKGMAKKNIELVGNLTDEELLGYYEDCIALIVPGIEDFGLSALEAQSFGKPVIALGIGGVLETVQKGRTGEFFYQQTSDALIEALKSFNANEYRPHMCIDNAKRFSEEHFKKKFTDFIESLA